MTKHTITPTEGYQPAQDTYTCACGVIYHEPNQAAQHVEEQRAQGKQKHDICARCGGDSKEAHRFKFKCAAWGIFYGRHIWTWGHDD